MKTVLLKLPQEVIDDLDIPYEGVRGGHDIVVAIEAIDVTASVVTLAALVPRLANLVNAIRRWRLHDRQGNAVMTVKGPGLELRIDLPPNIQSAEILSQLRPLLEQRPAVTGNE